MKLTRVRPKVYEGRVGGCRLVIAFRSYSGHDRRGPMARAYWHVRVSEAKKSWTTGGAPKTLAEAKAAAAKLWLGVELNAVHELIKGTVPASDFAEFHSLYLRCHAGADPLAVTTLHDWLEDHGKPGMLVRRVVLPGNRAKVVWPAGWAGFAAIHAGTASGVRVPPEQP